MTQHSSFRSNAASSIAKRNVLERFDLLEKRGHFKPGRVTGLSKNKLDA